MGTLVLSASVGTLVLSTVVGTLVLSALVGTLVLSTRYYLSGLPLGRMRLLCSGGGKFGWTGGWVVLGEGEAGTSRPA